MPKTPEQSKYNDQSIWDAMGVSSTTEYPDKYPRGYVYVLGIIKPTPELAPTEVLKLRNRQRTMREAYGAYAREMQKQ